MKGIILAGGKGTRLYPATIPVYKPLVPVYDKPLIYYPMTSLMKAGIRDILIITPPSGESAFAELFGDGSDLGLDITYKEQKVQRGIADAFIIGEDFVGDSNVCLALADNIFLGEEFDRKVRMLGKLKGEGATVFGYFVTDPRPFGVVEIENGRAVSIEEKPEHPKSNYIIPGLYFYDSHVTEIAKEVKPSARGELEITTVNEMYMKSGKLGVVTLDKCEWYDAGTADSLLDASFAVRRRMSGCPEEEAFRNGWIAKEDVLRLSERYKNDYGAYLKSLCR